MQGFIDECVFSVFCVLRRNSRWPPKMAKKRLLKKLVVDSADNLGSKILKKIAVSPTISEINTSLQFMQKFKMTDKMVGK